MVQRKLTSFVAMKHEKRIQYRLLLIKMRLAFKTAVRRMHNEILTQIVTPATLRYGLIHKGPRQM